MRSWFQRMVTALAAGLWLTLALLNLKRGALHPLTLLIAAQYALTATRLIVRRESSQVSTWRWQALAWGSALLPLMLRTTESPSVFIGVGLLMQIAGLLLALWALWSLGRAFGIAPADRGLTQCGPYRWLRHPAYAGELLALSGFLLGYPTSWNSAVFATVTMALGLRLLAEERVLANYAAYAGQVRWRICPGVW